MNEVDPLEGFAEDLLLKIVREDIRAEVKSVL